MYEIPFTLENLQQGEADDLYDIQQVCRMHKDFWSEGTSEILNRPIYIAYFWNKDTDEQFAIHAFDTERHCSGGNEGYCCICQRGVKWVKVILTN